MGDDPGTPTERPALEVPAGHAVLRRRADGGVDLCLKGQRRAKRHIQDYTVTLIPAGEDGPRLDFIDPEEPLTDCGGGLTFVPEAPADGRGHPRPGDLVETADGRWLAVAETGGPSRWVAFIDVGSGEVRRLRESAILALHRHWRLDLPAALAALVVDR
jgi:hypothetical protein